MADLPKTVLYPDAFRRSPSAGFDGVLHWDHWAPAIARRGIAPSDIDCVVEINGFFLVCESKDEGIEIQRGQRLLLDALIQSGLFTIIIRWGKEPPGKLWQVESWLGVTEKRFETPTQTVEQQESTFISMWAETVDKFPSDEWRRRLANAALKNAPMIRQELIAQLKKENREALGAFVDTPLGKTQVDI